MGPATLVFLIAAMASAFLRARSDQLARHNRTTDPPEGETRLLARPSAAAERYTPEGEEHLRRARVYRRLLYLFGACAAGAAWLQI